MGVRGALQKAKEREERGALAPQSADVLALADHLGVSGSGACACVVCACVVCACGVCCGCRWV